MQIRRIGLTTAIVAGGLALGAGGAGVTPAGAASATCSVQGERDGYEWGAQIVKRVKISCTGAKAVLKSCDKNDKLPSGWTVTIKNGTVTLRKKSQGRSFQARLAGASPSCIGSMGEG